MNAVAGVSDPANHVDICFQQPPAIHRCCGHVDDLSGCDPLSHLSCWHEKFPIAKTGAARSSVDCASHLYSQASTATANGPIV